MTPKNLKSVLLLFSLLALCTAPSLAQSDSLVVWVGSIRSQSDNALIPYATVASYMQVSAFGADDHGYFALMLPYKDSIRVAALGFEPRTIVLSQMEKDSTGTIHIKLKQHSFAIKEVTVKGYTGMLDPLIFPKIPDDPNAIDLHLPAHFGSRISKLPPNERPDIGNVGLLGAIRSPAGFIFSRTNRLERAKINLPEVRAQSTLWDHRDAVANPEIIALVSGYEGEELEKFVIYCNIHLKINLSDNGITASRKIKALLEEYEREE